MVILVTGGIGFIGSHTVQALADLGHGCVVTSHRTTRDLGDTVSIEQINVVDRDAMVRILRRPLLPHARHMNATPSSTGSASSTSMSPARATGKLNGRG